MHEYIYRCTLAMCRQPPRTWGCTGWAWHEALRTGQWVGCFAYCTGQSSASQPQPLESIDQWCQWWPCLVEFPPDSVDVLPFYCPALYWQRARPWTVHSTRFAVESTTGRVQWPINLLPAPAEIPTPGPRVKELFPSEPPAAEELGASELPAAEKQSTVAELGASELPAAEKQSAVAELRGSSLIEHQKEFID